MYSLPHTLFSLVSECNKAEQNLSKCKGKPSPHCPTHFPPDSIRIVVEVRIDIGGRVTRGRVSLGKNAEVKSSFVEELEIYAGVTSKQISKASCREGTTCSK